MANTLDKIAEVIEASTGEFVAQSYQLHWAPDLGSLVKTCSAPAPPPVVPIHESPLPPHVESPSDPGAESPYAVAEAPPNEIMPQELPLQEVTLAGRPAAIYGVVCYSATGSLEPGRRAVARGRDLDEEEDVYRQNPQLARVLCTSFKALIVGYQEGGQTHHFLPPLPPRVHSFVYPCSQQEVMEFTQALDFLPLLLGARLPIPTDELVAACLRSAAAAREDRRGFLVGAGKELALLLAAEPTRLNSLLRKIRP